MGACAPIPTKLATSLHRVHTLALEICELGSGLFHLIYALNSYVREMYNMMWYYNSPVLLIDAESSISGSE